MDVEIGQGTSPESTQQFHRSSYIDRFDVTYPSAAPE
jgi:hypothetical protein